MLSKILKLIDLRLQLLGIDIVYPAKNWIKTNAVKPIKTGLKSWISTPFKDNLVKPIIRGLKISYNSLKEDLRSAYNYFKNLDNRSARAGRYIAFAVEMTAIDLKDTAYDIFVWLPKTFAVDPLNRALDVRIKSLEKQYNSKVLSVSDQLKDHIVEQLKVAWEKANATTMDATMLLSVNAALDFTDATIIINQPKIRADLETPLTLTPQTRSIIRGTEQKHRSLNINLTSDFVEIFSHEKMDRAKQVDAVDVIRKAASSFLIERGYVKRHLDIAIHVSNVGKPNKRSADAPPITIFSHLLKANTGLQERAAAPELS